MAKAATKPMFAVSDFYRISYCLTTATELLS